MFPGYWHWNLIHKNMLPVFHWNEKQIKDIRFLYWIVPFYIIIHLPLIKIWKVQGPVLNNKKISHLIEGDLKLDLKFIYKETLCKLLTTGLIYGNLENWTDENIWANI